MDTDFDVAIVGAGPAGICASLQSSKNGIHTVLVEKKRVIGVPVRCGEFIPSREFLREILPSANNLDDVYALIPVEAVTQRIKSIKVYSPGNKCFEFKFDGIVVNRDLMEQSIAEKAIGKGVSLYNSSVVRGFVNGEQKRKLLIRNETGDMILNAKVVIGADGFPSGVARWANMKLGYGYRDMALTVQNVAVNVEGDYDSVEMFTGNKYVPGGFGWIIPKGEKVANVGLGLRLSHLRSNRGFSIRQYFDAYINRHPLVSKKLSKAKLRSFSAKMVPVGGEPLDICKQGVILTGDAAGLVVATNGSGIPTAMLSGDIAGKIVSEYLKGNCELSCYSTRLKSEIIPVIARGVSYRHAADLLMKFDSIFDTALRLIGVGYMSQVLKCKKNFYSDLFQKIF